ncbi:MAG: helix-turn-helix transcriptional regulator [Clostridia bacterium]|nr:helix-turn-helix transcriptional regulator [Clostridia bacterium]
MSVRLKDIREDRDLSQKTVADLLNVRQNTYSQYESGKRQIPIESLIKLAAVYQVSVDYMLELTDTPTPYPRKK